MVAAGPWRTIAPRAAAAAPAGSPGGDDARTVHADQEAVRPEREHGPGHRPGGDRRQRARQRAGGYTGAGGAVACAPRGTPAPTRPGSRRTAAPRPACCWPAGAPAPRSSRPASSVVQLRLDAVVRQRRRRPGTRTTTSISSEARWRAHGIGAHSGTGCSRDWPKPQTTSAKPASDSSVYSPQGAVLAQARAQVGAQRLGEHAHRVHAQEDHESG